MKVIDSWNIGDNFWTVNPQLTVISEFKNLLDKDKSKGKDNSSRIMWAIALFTDIGSKYRSLPDSDKKHILIKEIIKDEKFDWSTIEPLITVWRNKFLSPAQKQLILWESYMQEKNQYMANLMESLRNEYKKEIADEVEKKLLSNGALFDEYNRLQDLLAQEEDAGRVQGGGQESLTEKGEI
jgi:hypothetical protein